ncbi:hypothetical protein MASR1M90_21560 [Desulfovibrionales bacterium]
MNTHDNLTPEDPSLRKKIIGLSESSGRKSYYPLLQQKIRQLQEEIAERERAEKNLRNTLTRIARQQTAMAEIATHPSVFDASFLDASMITEKMARALQTDQASLWLIRDNALCCVDKFLSQPGQHIAGQCIGVAEMPSYVASLAQGSIAVADTFADPRTRDLEGYCRAHAIGALLDVPVHVYGQLVAVVSFEHGSSRGWWPDEVTFASRIADQVALMLANERRRQAEEQLRDAHALLQRNLHFTEALLDAMPIPVFYKDNNLRYLGCNRIFSEIMGYSSEDIRGKTATEVWPQIPPAHEEADRYLLAQGGHRSFESTLRDKEKKQRAVIVAKQVFNDANKVSAGIIGSFLDITELKQSLLDNEHLRAILSNIINSMPSMLIGVDRDACITHWNLRAAQVTGVPQHEALGRQLSALVPWLEPEIPKILHSMHSKQPFFDSKLSRNVHGETVYENVTMYPLVTNDVDGAVIRIDNVTENVRMEEVLQQSEKMLSLGGLAAGMAHEINNPLASVMGNIQVLETRLGKPIAHNIQAAHTAGTTFEQIKRYMELRGVPHILHTVRESSAQAAEIVRNMLSFSRKSSARHEPVDIVLLLEKTLTLTSAEYGLKKISIIKDFAPNLPKVMGRPGTLQQVFVNLLRNSAEAMREKTYAPHERPCITLRAYRYDQWVRVEVEDNGPGMDEATRKRIFEPFFTTKAPGKGTGLGLSVSYFIITEEHQGRMDILSAPGEWSCFVLDLPLTDTEPMQEQQEGT